MAVAIKNLPGLQITTLENTNANMQRLGVLNDSYRKRYATYTKIAAMVVIFLVGFILIQMAEPMLPGVVTNILMIVLILVVGSYIAKYFSELGSRSRLNYDELDLPTNNPGEKDKLGNLTPSSAADLLGEQKSCADDSCCAEGTKYNRTLGKCIKYCYGVSASTPFYKISDGSCAGSPTPSPASDYIDTTPETFTNLGNFNTSGEQYVDKSRMSLPISAVTQIDTGLIPSNVGIDKYTAL